MRIFALAIALTATALACTAVSTPEPEGPLEPVAISTIALPTKISPTPTVEPATPAQAEDTSPSQRLPDPEGPWLIGRTRTNPVAMKPDGSDFTSIFSSMYDIEPNDWLDSEISQTGWVAQTIEKPGDGPTLLIAGPPTFDQITEISIMTPELASARDALGDDGQPKVWSEDVYLALNSYGFMNPMEWSPDGQMIAFNAAIDGPSADVYVHDIGANETRRLTSGPNQPYLLGWSGDGQWVLHLEIMHINAGDGVWFDTVGMWAAAADGSGAIKVPGIESAAYLVNWSSPSEFTLVYDTYGPLPPFQFDQVHLDRGPISTLYPGSVTRWAVDPETGTIAFRNHPESDLERESLPEGLYIVSPSSPEPVLVSFINESVEPYFLYGSDPVWSQELNAFSVNTEADSIALVSTDGEIIRWIQGACSHPMVSPDARWIAYESCDESAPKIHLRSEDTGEIIELEATREEFNEFFWSYDSSGLYYFVGERPEALMYKPIEGGTPVLVHPNSGMRSGFFLPQWAVSP